MKTVLLAAVLCCTACGTTFHSSARQRAADLDALYWHAVWHADPANPRGSLDSTVALLDKYLAGETPAHTSEARALRQLAKDAQQLNRVTVALQQAKASATENKQRAEAAENKPDDQAVREIERLKDELAKARDELERIKKRLAAPPAKP